jgi:hypothetical protein
MQLDDDFFASLGQALNEQQKQTIASNIYSELEDRVGEKLESQLSDSQYTEFEIIVAKGNEPDLDDWLSANAPGYEQLVDQTLEQIKQEAKTGVNKFLD